MDIKQRQLYELFKALHVDGLITLLTVSMTFKRRQPEPHFFVVHFTRGDLVYDLTVNRDETAALSIVSTSDKKISVMNFGDRDEMEKFFTDNLL